MPAGVTSSSVEIPQVAAVIDCCGSVGGRAQPPAARRRSTSVYKHKFAHSNGFVKLYVMPKFSPATDSLPAASAASLRKLGNDLMTARKRRKQSLRDWALRLSVSVPTLTRMEKGDPTVSAGIYATALWLIGRHDALAQLADPRDDRAALESDVSEARERHRRSSDRGG